MLKTRNWILKLNDNQPNMMLITGFANTVILLWSMVYFRKYNNQEYCVHYSYGLNNKSYKYYFENHGYDNYNIYSRKYNKSKRR